MGSEVEWLTAQSEYRPTQYLQGWVSFWFDDIQRLNAAKQFQQMRLEYIKLVWKKDRDLRLEGFDANDMELEKAFLIFSEKTRAASQTSDLLLIEAQLTKKLYKFAAIKTQNSDFTRKREAIDAANGFLNHGNYLAYGLAATTLWVLGIPHGFAVMHGKTRKGALVFDVADLVKDAIILPWAFICAKEKATEQEFRQQCLRSFTDHKALDFMFNQVKDIALQGKIEEPVKQ
jgi:CRISPR-associated protein Cas1